MNISATQAATETAHHECPQCGSTALREEKVKSSFWHGDRLVVVEDIPALVCGRCGERFYDDATITALDLMHGGGFPAGEAKREMHVPIFSFAHRVPSELAPLQEEET
ncbi:type II toxin-antitoxin system MqsA family antitoxin [Chelativorans xinjiangense]|uniref:type II toxin-antitoxin system MqsA family antitoxin n=1 Tax=Chelativorans xinjiangense TaxID=2681485 RepID=UPI00135C25CF|nr:type II toxin-antitoxin system MqsA family antitoxin [Chelativorans xinjiangense]